MSNLERNAGALAVLARGLELGPSSPDILYNRAVVLQRTGDAAGARKLLTRALELRTDFPAARAALTTWNGPLD